MLGQGAEDSSALLMGLEEKKYIYIHIYQSYPSSYQPLITQAFLVSFTHISIKSSENSPNQVNLTSLQMNTYYSISIIVDISTKNNGHLSAHQQDWSVYLLLVSV